MTDAPRRWFWRAVYVAALGLIAWNSFRERAARLAFENEVRVRLDELADYKR